MKIKVCQSTEVPQDGMAAFETDQGPVLIANVKGIFYAISDTCTHAEASLCEGYLDVGELTVECPLHQAVFNIKNGEALEFPAEDPVTSYKVSVEGGELFIEVAEG